MKHFLFSLLLSLAAAYCSGQDLKIWHKYKPGSKYKFEYVKLTSGAKYAGKTLTGITQYDLIVDKEDIAGIHVKWKIGPTEISGLDAAELEKIKPLLNINKDFELQLLLNKEGKIIGLENYEACQEHIKKILVMLTGLMANQITADISAQLDAVVAATTSDASLLLTSYFPEISLYFELYGQSYSDGVFYVMESLTPLGFDNLFAPFQTNIKVTKTPGKNTEIDLAMLCNQGILNGANEQMGDPGADWVKFISETKDRQIQINKNYSINAVSRMVEGLTLKKSVVLGGQTATEEVRLRLLKS